jgi:NADP-dependent 3-hydroxy acid dehydrogenase YdfG
MPTAVVIGVGPGLGMSIAHRFGREGFDVALISRSGTRHAGYLSALADAGVTASAHVADVLDGDQLLSTVDKIGAVDVVYYGPGAVELDAQPAPITEASATEVADMMAAIYPAIDVARRVLPGMLERGAGGLLFAGGLSAVQPMPALGALAVGSAAMRNYVLTLNAGLAGTGVYAGILTIGGLVERGDIHRFVTSHPERFGDVGDRTLDPDEIADTAWALYSTRDSPEATFSVFG